MTLRLPSKLVTALEIVGVLLVLALIGMMLVYG
jgi:hypothetical protein